MRSIALLVTVLIISVNASANSASHINSALSVNQALKSTLPTIPYTGKDLKVSEMDLLQTHIQSTQKFIC